MIRRAWEWLKDLVTCSVAIFLLLTLIIASLAHDWETDETLSWMVQE